MKRRLLWLLSAVLVVLLAACGTSNDSDAADESGNSGNSSEDAKRVAVVLTDKIGVNPFFQQISDGATKAADEAGLEVNVIESSDPTEIEQNLQVAVAEDYDLILTATFDAVDALTRVAEQNPEQDFAIIDAVVDLPNVKSAEFREYEASFLLGAAAGLSTETNKIGIVLAMDVPQINKYKSGFEEGVAHVNSEAEVLSSYVGSFADPAKAKEIALQQNANGADFIAAASAVSDLGVFEAAKEEGFYTSGQDIDRTTDDPEHIVLSQLKNTDVVAYDFVKEYGEGNFETGTQSFGVAEDGVGLTFVTAESESPLSDFIGQETIDKVTELKDQIISGELTVTNPLAQ
ncbi:BMP family ABC transporter substrate-binding protein [Gracilibacillus oryzae]|uniref:BMP family ABC transporter substrate-binding protein n=1 Tax=Gracilibacillus oryzae TaxID=1672701 RepID=A0A7C8KSZ3_9BACI|nr:BMP family protein [Gracilibacillus oryzae]KAB8139417.1 BMP family ABC transporter substrate-binding protein [Gracilibacillus oryzae]